MDHPRTFFAVAKLNSALPILCIVANFSLSLHWLKVKNAFLNCDLQEEYEEYMDQPSGFTSKGEEGKVCRLKKALYRLKQSPVLVLTGSI